LLGFQGALEIAKRSYEERQDEDILSLDEMKTLLKARKSTNPYSHPSMFG